MTTARECMEKAATKLAGGHPVAAQIGAVYKFVLSGEGGGTWVATLKDPPSIVEGDGPADCTLTLAASDYVELLFGRVPAQGLFFQGKLQIDGEIGLAMKLEALSSILR